MAGVSTKEIKNRIRSLESTKQITKAMEMVAASKLRRAQNQVLSSRPYFEILRDTIQSIVSANREFSSPYLKESAGEKLLYIVIAGDRGLAGGYNSNILKLVLSQIAGKDAAVLPMGKKTADFFRSRNFICDDKWNIFKCDSYPAVLENIRNKKAAGSLPQLFCCHNDIIAAWVIQACGELNIDIPGNLSVVGFNGMPLPEYNGLATIQHPFYGIGHAAVCELLERHRNPRHTSGNVVKIATGFIDGKTLGKPYHN